MEKSGPEHSIGEFINLRLEDRTDIPSQTSAPSSRPDFPWLLAAVFAIAISVEVFAEVAESLDLISRSIEADLNFVCLLIWGAAGLLVAFRIKDHPLLRWVLVLGSFLFVLSQFINITEEVVQAKGVVLGESVSLAVNLIEKSTRVLGWGFFFSGLYLLVLELDRRRGLLLAEADELRREIEKRRRIEIDLRNKEDIYRRAIAQAEAVPYQRDYLTGSYTFIDDGIKKLTGYSPTELTPPLWENEIVQESLMGKDHRHLPLEKVLQDIREGKLNRWKDDCRIRTRTGEVRWCTDASIQILGDDGLPVGSIGILQDITEKKRAEAELEQRIEFERLVTTLSADFIQATDEEIDEKIQRALQAIGEFARVDRCFLIRFDEAVGAAVLTHEWTREGIRSHRDRWGVVPFESFPWFYETLSRGDVIQTSVVSDLPPVAQREREAIESSNVGSFLFVPQSSGGKTSGFIGFDSYEAGRSWPDHTLSLLQVVGRIFSHAMDRIATEQAAHTSKERYRILFENSHDAIYMTDPEGNLLDANPAFLKLFGYSREDVPTLSLPEVFTSPEEEARLRNLLEREGRTSDYEAVLHRKDRTRIDALLTCSTRTDAQGDFAGHQGIIRDITEKRRAEKAFRLIVEGTSGAVGAAFFESLTRALAGVIGVRFALVSELVDSQPERLKSLAFWTGRELGSPFEIDAARSDFEQILSSGFVFQPRGVSETGEPGSLFDRLGVECHLGVRLSDAAGNPIGILSVFDSNEFEGDSRTAENLIRIFAARASAEILRICAEETRRDLERRMFETQKTESLGVLAGGIAHDFNNLLTSILGNVCLAQYDLEEDSPLQGYLRNVERATQRAADLAQQMLAYSGKSKFVVEPLQVNDLLEEVEQILSVALPKNVVFEKEFAIGLPCLDGDATQLRQVFMNLVINAGESMNNKAGVIRMRTRQIWFNETYPTAVINREDLRQGPYLEIRIADNGCGMNEETRAKIFDPFFTTKFTGRGLGLAAVLGIVRGHSGGIGVESAEGKGTTFTLLLPAAHQEVDRKPEEMRVRASAGPGSGLILVVDDEEAVRTVAERILVRGGYDVLVASDGIEGILLFEKHRSEIDLVLLDLNMPNLSGEETYRRMQALSPGMKVVIMSGYSEQEALTLCEDFGLTAFLQKPFLPEVLLNKVGSALAAKPNEAASPS